MQLELLDRTGRVDLDRTYRAQAGSETSDLTLDAPAGVYRLDMQAPEFGCAASQYVYFLGGHGRLLALTLNERALPPAEPLYLLAGTIPPSLSYLRPAPVLFAGSAECDEPVVSFVPGRSSIDYDRDSFYASVYAVGPDTPMASLTFALRLSEREGAQHYVRLPLPFPIAFEGWPVALRMDIALPLANLMMPETASWLICPKLSLTSSK